MRICSEHDGEVCYEDRECPACLLQDTIDDLKKKVERLEADIKTLEDS